MTFKELHLIPPLLSAVSDAGYTQPSPIQEKAIPPVLAGRDLLGCAQTGTGKTAAFALPILQLLSAKAPREKNAIRALVLTPTRELALQIQENFELYGKNLKQRSTVIFGGVGQQPQVAKLKKGVDILVATPGRLNDLIGQGYIKLQNLEIFVLDEADRMLDMGFVHDVKRVIKEIPEKRQTLLFSATMPDEIVSLANSLLHKPAKVFVTPASTTVEAIEQSLYKIDKPNKRKLLAKLLQEDGVESALVFTRTKHGADRVTRELNKKGIPALAIHGNKGQNARQEALARFKNGKVKALVATDIAARGLDIQELSHVFNYDLPNVPETYVHRIGRTGRAGRDGIAVSFCQFDELEYLKDIEKLIGFSVPEVKDHEWPMEIFEAAPKQQRQPREQGRKSAETKQQAEKGRGKKAKGQKNAPVAPAAKAETKPPLAQKPTAAQAGGQSKGQNPPQTRKGESNRPAQKNKQGPRGKGQGQKRGMPFDPYDNLTGGKAIVTKAPVWSNMPEAPAPAQSRGDDSMSRNRRRGGKNRKRGGDNKPAKDAKSLPAIPKNEKGVFDFSETELAEDHGLSVISRKEQTETKFANFEEYLAAQNYDVEETED